MRKLITKLMVVVITISLFSCSKKVETVTLREWFLNVNDELGLSDVEDAECFYHITKEDSAYQAVGNLVAWGVLDKTVNLNLDQELNREWVAYTLVHLDGSELDAIRVKDAGDSLFPDEISKSVALGMMSVDKRGCFKPKELVDRSESYELLEKIVERINNREITHGYETIQYSSDVMNAPIVEWINEAAGIVNRVEGINAGDYVQIWEDDVTFYKVIRITDDGMFVELPEFSEVVDELEVEDSFVLDFSEVEIEGDDIEEISLEGLSSFTPNVSLIPCGMSVARSKEVNGFNINYSFTGGTAAVRVNKKLNDGASFYSDITLSNIQPVFKWKSKGNHIEDAYFKVSFKTTEDIGLKEGQYKNYYGDFTKLDGKDFLNSLSNVFKEKKAGVDTVIPICTVKVPLPHAPTVKLVMQLVVKVSASGRIELGITNEHMAGLEIRNNQLRTFHEHGHDIDFILKANAESSLGTMLGINFSKYRLADVGIDAGIETTVKTTAHLYDKNGEKTMVNTQLPLSVVDVLSEGKEDVKFCGDLVGNWTLDLVFNEAGSLASKVGLYKKIDALSEDNAPLFKVSKLHLEDGIFVDACTRSNKNKSLITELPVTSKIQIQDYSLSLNPGEQKRIIIKGLPKNVLLRELTFKSMDEGIASVSSDGLVTAKESGNTLVMVSTRDGKYETQCYVMVKFK